MKQRTTNKNHPRYHRYGGRGIVICDEWQDFTSFANWGVENGYNDKLSLDRIDNDQGYSPRNCRWVTALEQAANRVNSFNPPVGPVVGNVDAKTLYTYEGKSMTLSEWAKEKGMRQGTLYMRVVYRGMPLDKALSGRLKNGSGLYRLKNPTPTTRS